MPRAFPRVPRSAKDISQDSEQALGAGDGEEIDGVGLERRRAVPAGIAEVHQGPGRERAGHAPVGDRGRVHVRGKVGGPGGCREALDPAGRRDRQQHRQVEVVTASGSEAGDGEC